MALLIGEAIDGRELEQFTSPWSPERFASMCDALAWAASGRQCSSLPSFTARVDARDGGIDAEWSVNIPADGHSVSTPILGPGWNVFQYKKRDLIAQDRRRVISNLKSSLAGAVRDLRERERRAPDRYLLFVNVDLKHDDKRAIKESILKGDQGTPSLHVEIAGAGELAALLNAYPHLRAAYFTPGFFKTWEEANNAHRRHKLFGFDVELIGREEELDRLRSFVDDSRVRAIVLSGSHDIGKSRLALAATRRRPHDVVLALDPRSLQLGDYRGLGTDRGNVICIVEDPEPDSVERLINESLSSSNLKFIITLPTAANVPVPSYGYDERVQFVHLEPLTEENTRKLLRATGQPLGFEIETWILRQAGGIPGLLLAAASIGDGLRAGLADFATTVGRQFEERIRKELGAEVLQCARLFAVLTHVRISGREETDLRQICAVFGEGWTPNRALLSFTDLERAGLAKRGGSFAEITIPLLANYLVAQLLQAQHVAMFALFGRLDEAGQVRFIRRLSEVKSGEAELFWDEAFAPDGPFGNLQRALGNVHLLGVVAGTVPERVLHVLEGGLQDTTREERLAIVGGQRRELMWTIEQLLFRLKTSRGAVRLLWLLAEAENETCSNNATGVLTESFHPFHPQMPLPLQERIALLDESFANRSSQEKKLVVVKIVEGALSRRGSFVLLRYSEGLEPFDPRPLFTYQELADYCCRLVDVLFALVDGDSEVTAAALRVLPAATEELGSLARPQEALERFHTLVTWAYCDKVGLEVPSLSSALHLFGDLLSARLDEPNFPLDRKHEFEQYIDQVKQLKAKLETASFALRLKRWAGEWAYDEYEDELMSGTVPRYQKELMRLAEEAVREPGLLTTKLVDWLLAPAAQRSSIFFSLLGSKDENLIFQERIEEIGQRSEGTNAFAAYWSNWAIRDGEAAERRLDELASLNAVTGDAIVQATVNIRVSQRAVDRVSTQVRTGRALPERTGGLILASLWREHLTGDQFERLLKVIAGETFEYAATAIGMLSRWMHSGRSLQGSLADFAWRCLEHDPPLRSPQHTWESDWLAAKLAQDDLDRGFQLLQILIQKDQRDVNSWDPLSQFEAHRFWDVLHANDRKRLFELLLNVARTSPVRKFHVSWRLKGLLNQEEDKDLLLAFATDVENARIIASCSTAANPGFWPLAFELVRTHPHDETVLSNLVAGILQEGSIHEGPTSQFYKTCKQEVERVLRDPSTPPEAHSWLRDVISRLEREIPRKIVWEYDIDVEELCRHIQDRESPQRMWALGRVLKYAAWEDIKRLLTVEDIEEVLPQIDLPEKKRKVLEKALKVWRHEQ
jgi:hypothetical protein